MAKTKEAWKIYKNVFDEFTINTLNKLQATKYYDELLSPICIGKESNIFSASKKGEQIIIKIYRLENCDFNKMLHYMKLDPRYFNLRATRRTTIFNWVQREFRNLQKAREAGVSVPLPIKFVNNILIETMVGKDAPAPKVKDQRPEDPEKFYKETIKNMVKLARAGLVHGDLSEYNILNLNEKPVFIDMSQSTPSNSMLYNELVERDSRNISRFFKKLGVKTSQEEIRELILKETKKLK